MKNSNRSSLRRFKLMASGSLAALCLLGAGAANAQTCPGDFCTGTYTTINYANVYDYVEVTLGHALNVTTGGFHLTAANPAYTPIYSGGPVSPLGIHLNNNAGAAFEVVNPEGFFDIFISKGSSGAFAITGTTAGVKLNGSGYLALTGSGTTVNATQGAGIDIQTVTDGFVDLGLMSNISGSTAALRITGGGEAYMNIAAQNVFNGNLVFENKVVSAFHQGLWTGGSMTSTGATSIDWINQPVGVMEGTFALHNTGGLKLQNRGTWRVSGNNLMGDGSTDRLINTGVMMIGGLTQSAATASIGNLEVWDNTGLVLFGSNAGATASDGVTNDRLVFASPTFLTGEAGGLFVMDVNFGTQGQLNCEAAVVADCVDFGGSTATGITPILINNVGGTGSLAPIVLVDNASDITDFDGFVISPNSAGYVAVGGGMLKLGVFEYGLSLINGQYILTPNVNTSILGFAKVGSMASSVWSATTGHWQTRQVDLRDTLEDTDGAHVGVWIKALGNNVERTAPAIVEFGGSPVVYDQSYMQETRGFIGGVDLVNVTGEDTAFVVGLMAGKVNSDVTFKGRAADTTLEGGTYGAYASYVTGSLFVDALVNVNDLDVFYPMIDTANFDEKVKTVGAQVEAGYRLGINEGAAFLEPIAALAYVKQDLGEREISPSLTADFGEPTVVKGALGLRLGGSKDIASAKVGLAITGRVWETFSGEDGLTLTSGQTQQVIEDELGTLGDVGVQLNLTSANRRLSAFADYGFKFREDYSDSTASVGVRFSF